MQLSPHFSLREATYSATAQDHKLANQPNPEQLERMKYTALKMEVVRQLLDDRPIMVTSWFRGIELNRLIGGVATSQHSRGEAVDFKCLGYGDPRAICKELQRNKDLLQYDQLILEPSWVHISFTLDKPRRNDLTFIAKNRYIPGIS